MATPIPTTVTDGDDVFVWPNDDWCFRCELDEYGYNMSDDYTVLPVDSPAAETWLRTNSNY